MFRDLGKLLGFTGQFCSDVITLPVHYFGRSIPCAGENCEACLYRSPRRLSYCALCTPHGVPAMYELCESFMSSVIEGMSAVGAEVFRDATRGLVVSAKRASTRNAWCVERLELVSRRGQVVTMVELLGAVTRLYRLPLPLPSEEWQSWFERVRVEQNDLLKASLLPFGRRKVDLHCHN